jgi:hypothetical protein
MVMPGCLMVVNHSSTQATCRVDASTGDRYSGKVYHEHSKPNWKRCQNLHFIKENVNKS